MTALPKKFFVLGAAVQTARMARRLKQPRTAVPEQWQTFSKLTANFAPTQFGKANGIDARIDYPAFRGHVPVRAYEQFVPFIERMTQGEPNVLSPGACSWFATTAGTVSGSAKILPVTDGLLNHFREAAYDSLLFYAARVDSSSVFEGRHLLLGLSTALQPVASSSEFRASQGELSAILGAQLPDWVEKYFYEPGASVAAIADWNALIEATAERTINQDITLLAGLPNWLLVLGEALRKKNSGANRSSSTLRDLWPNLECIVHCGVPVAPFQEELRQLAGSAVKFHEVYFSSEGFIAAQDADATAGLRLLTDAGLFYEFIPWSDFDEASLAAVGSKAVPLEQVRPGIDYVVLLTTPGGLCRYVLEDVVRFVSIEPPRLVYVGRTRLQLNTFGEHVSEKELTDSLVTVCRRHNWTITNFHVAPLTTSSLTGQVRGRHEWWVELLPGTNETPTGPVLAGQVDAELCARNPNYDAKRKSGPIDAPFVRLVMPRFFEHWMRNTGRERGQAKMPRSRNDRVIADELASLACFTAD
jgi:hypothetical protein